MKIYETIHEAYLGSLVDVYDNPDSTSAPRGQKVREKFDYQFKILNPKPESIVTLDLERNKVIADYSKKEFDWYESGDISVESAIKISKFWGKLANPDGTLNSNYGFLALINESHGNSFELEQKPHPAFPGKNVYEMVPKKYTPFNWCVQALRDDKDTRQAVLRFSLPQHFWKGNKDFTCTLHGYFQIRDNKLSLTINMRSNDLTLGLVYDLPWFISLIYKMKDQLKDVYPDLEIGNYTHYVHNLHIYDRDEEKILKMIGRL